MQENPAFFLKNGPLYLIAEIGTSHGGERSKVRELVQAAAQAGADCAKFQVVFAQEIIHPLTGELDLPGGRVRLYDRFRAVERDADFYAFCKEETEKVGLDFLASPFGLQSARLLRGIGSRWYKVASPELNHFPLLKELASYKSPLILSSGVSRLGDIEAAWDILDELPKALLHCVTAYPAPPEDYNLRVLKPLSLLFGCPVGVSDHSMDPELVPGVAVAAGARLLEKHICLDRNDSGLDDPIALEPSQFDRMVRTVREGESLGEAKRTGWAADRFGRSRVDDVLGDGRKRLAPSEKANYERTNRSLHVRDALPAGHVLQQDDVAVLRTEKILRPGLAPGFLPVVIGKRLQRSIEAGQGLVWDDFLQSF